MSERTEGHRARTRLGEAVVCQAPRHQAPRPERWHDVAKVTSKRMREGGTPCPACQHRALPPPTPAAFQRQRPHEGLWPASSRVFLPGFTTNCDKWLCRSAGPRRLSRWACNSHEELKFSSMLFQIRAFDPEIIKSTVGVGGGALVSLPADSFTNPLVPGHPE